MGDDVDRFPAVVGEEGDPAVLLRQRTRTFTDSLLLLERNATVTMCHSRTRDLAAVTREADVLVAAAGSALLVKGDWIKPGAAVIDLGVNVIDGRQVGDVDFDAALGVAGLLTPSRGGVGPLTITMLLRNTLQAYRHRAGV
jgi:methylenetetrahydrofolate dehydrogenase (NADP+)/methenyltetrahydrofolate cyclohydrolase